MEFDLQLFKGAPKGIGPVDEVVHKGCRVVTDPRPAPASPPKGPSASYNPPARPVVNCINCGQPIHEGISGNVKLWFHEDGTNQCPDWKENGVRQAKPPLPKVEAMSNDELFRLEDLLRDPEVKFPYVRRLLATIKSIKDARLVEVSVDDRDQVSFKYISCKGCERLTELEAMETRAKEQVEYFKERDDSEVDSAYCTAFYIVHGKDPG